MFVGDQNNASKDVFYHLNNYDSEHADGVFNTFLKMLRAYHISEQELLKKHKTRLLAVQQKQIEKNKNYRAYPSAIQIFFRLSSFGFA